LFFVNSLETLSKAFSKEERLCSKKIIDVLFKKGAAEFSHPIRLLYLSTEIFPPPLPQVLFSVSKKHFKRAVDRNLLKRRMREAYRLHKGHFLTSIPGKKFPYALGFIYIAKEKLSFQEIEKKVILLMKRLSK
jgi:ribonuclease P protein component